MIATAGIVHLMSGGIFGIAGRSLTWPLRP